MTGQADTLRSPLPDERHAGMVTILRQLTQLGNGNYGAPVKLTGYSHATTYPLTIQNGNSGASAPALNVLDNASAIIVQATKAGVTLGKATTLYPSLTVQDGVSGTTNLSVTTTGVSTRPLLNTSDGTTTFMQSNSTELLVRPQLRVWNGTTDFLKSTSTELLVRPQLRVWNGTNESLVVTASAFPTITINGAPLWHTPLIGPCDTDLTLTTSYQDISGTDLTLPGVGWWLLIGTIYFVNSGDTGAELIGKLVVSGGSSLTLNSSSVIEGARYTDDAFTNGQTWLVKVISGTPTVKLQAKKTSGAGSSKALSDSTTLTAAYLGTGTTT